MRILILHVLFMSLLFSKNINQPIASFQASGPVVDLLYSNGKIYSSTGAGSVDIFDYSTRKLIKKIELKKIKDFIGDEVDSKVYSVDILNGKILILSQSEQGFRRVHIHEDEKTKLIIDFSEALTIAKAKFLDSNTILLALLSNELISYDIKNHRRNWMIQVSGAKFSDFVLNESKSEVIVADESGNLKIHSTNNGKHLRTLSGENLDNVFQVDYKKGIIATAGQDRKMVIYTPKLNSAYSIKSNFLVYSVGLSPSGMIVGYACDEENNIMVMNTTTKSSIAKFGGNNMTLSKIVFIGEDEFLAASDDRIINLYSVK